MTTREEVPDIPLPDVGENDEAAHIQIGQRFRQHTAIEIRKENRLQASEKIWASSAHSLKAIAENRGWQHDSHSLLRNVAMQLARESRDRELVPLFREAEGMHNNFYENDVGWDEIAGAQESARRLAGKLATLRNRPPGRFAINRNLAPTALEGEQTRLANLLGVTLPGDRQEHLALLNRLFPPGVTSDVGFSPNYGYTLPPDGGSGGSPARPTSDDNPPASGGGEAAHPRTPIGDDVTLGIGPQAGRRSPARPRVCDDVDLARNDAGEAPGSVGETRARYRAEVYRPAPQSKPASKSRPHTSRPSMPAEIRSFPRQARRRS